MSLAQSVTVDVADISPAFELAAGATYDLVNSLDHTADFTPGGEWSVRETVVHLICFSRLYRRFLSGSESPVRRPEDLAAINAGFFVAMDEDSPATLAALLKTATSAYASSVASHDVAELCPFHFGRRVDVATMMSVSTYELLMHGWDMAEATDRTLWDDVAAAPTLRGIAASRVRLVPSDLTREKVTLVICPNDEPQFAYVLGPSGASISPAEPHREYDCSVSGSPFSLLLWLSGRVGWEDAGLASSGIRPDVGRGFRLMRL